MLDFNAAREGMVLRDLDADPGKETRAFYKITMICADHFDTTHLATGSPTVVSSKAVRDGRFEAVGRQPHNETDLTPLLGRHVKCSMAFGTLTGVLTEIRYFEVDIDGAAFRFPKEFIINGDSISINEITAFATL